VYVNLHLHLVRCPAVRSALDAVPEAYHNPAAVWWGPLAASAVIRDQVVIVKPAAGPLSPTTSAAVAHPRLTEVDLHRGVARLAAMRRILLGGIAGVLLLAVGTRAADALGIGGPRLRCGCTETCWCKRPGLTVFRWVTPGRWHHIGFTAEEKRSRHSQT